MTCEEERFVAQLEIHRQNNMYLLIGDLTDHFDDLAPSAAKYYIVGEWVYTVSRGANGANLFISYVKATVLK